MRKQKGLASAAFERCVSASQAIDENGDHYQTEPTFEGFLEPQLYLVLSAVKSMASEPLFDAHFDRLHVNVHHGAGLAVTQDSLHMFDSAATFVQAKIRLT